MSVTAYIQSPDESNIYVLSLYDDGNHGDLSNGDGTYGNIWDSSGYPETTYYVDIVAIDSSLSNNLNELENIDKNILIDCGCG